MRPGFAMEWEERDVWAYQTFPTLRATYHKNRKYSLMFWEEIYKHDPEVINRFGGAEDTLTMGKTWWLIEKKFDVNSIDINACILLNDYEILDLLNNYSPLNLNNVQIDMVHTDFSVVIWLAHHGATFAESVSPSIPQFSRQFWLSYLLSEKYPSLKPLFFPYEFLFEDKDTLPSSVRVQLDLIQKITTMTKSSRKT